MSSVSVQDVSFAGGGFLGIYHVGVAACLLDHAPHLLEYKLVGASAGAMFAAALVGGVPLPQMTRVILNIAERARLVAPVVLSSAFKLDEALNDNLQKILPDDIHVRASDRVYVAMTTLVDGKQLLVSKFSSRSELIAALRASSYVPFVSNWGFPRFRGQLVCDGVCSDVHPTRPSTATITVSPFAGMATISPSDPAWIPFLVTGVFAGWPPSVARSERLCEQGYKDAMTFLLDENHLSCSGCEEDDQDRCAIVHPTDLSPEMKEVFTEAKEEEVRGYAERNITKLQGAILQLALVWFSPLLITHRAISAVASVKLPSIETDVFGPPSYCLPLTMRPSY